MMHLRHSAKTLFVSVIALTVCMQSGCSDPTDAGKTASRKVDELFEPLNVATQPGAAVMIIRDGKILHQGYYGFADLDRRIPITSETNFRLASVSKQFAAMAIMILEEEGQISYDDPISQYVPELAAYPGVTVRHLLQHTGGLPDYYDLIDTSGDVPTNDDALRLLGEMASPDFAPGERYEYSNPGYDMLGPIVEAAAGMPFVDFVRERIFKPLNMSNSLVHDHTFPDITNRAIGYDPVAAGFEPNDYDPLNGIVGSGGIYSNLEDMYRWDQALYGEQLVSQESLDAAFTAGRNNRGESIDYGFGWRIETTRGHKRVRHGGSWVGFRTHIARIPDLRFSIVILSNNSAFEPGEYIDPITDIYLGPAVASTAAPGPTAAENEASIDLSVMSFNIEWGGDNISFDNVITAIRKSGASIAGIQEAEGNLQRLAGALGWNYDLRNYVISGFPLVDPPGADGKYVLAEVRPGQVVAIANVHLPSDPYGPDAIRDGAGPDDVLELERTTRLPAIQPYLQALAPLVERRVPLFLTGDFNAPAHTDWTDATVGERPFLHYAMAWPVSQAVAAAGFRDSWRVVHPDPVSDPGLTWWAGRPPLEAYAPGENDAQDRIDFVWYAGPVKALSANVVGEAGGPGVSVSVMPWPSDHRAVVSDFKVVPATMPEVVSTSHRVYTHGDDIDISYNIPPGESRLISVANSNTGVYAVTDKLVEADGKLHLGADVFEPGSYEASMTHTDGSGALLRNFWVLAAAAVPAVQISNDTFVKGQAIGITWSNAPGNRNDYVAIFSAGVAPASEKILAWAYVDAAPSGEMSLDVSGRQHAPLEPGRYVVRLMKDDGYEPLATSPVFTVEP